MPSLPLWERGLKYIDTVDNDDDSVAPLVGAWIEISNKERNAPPGRVAPLVGAWIEIVISLPLNLTPSVAPLVGAWIEIPHPLLSTPTFIVAPLVGAWIEIRMKRRCNACMTSLPLWERGLKSLWE